MQAPKRLRPISVILEATEYDLGFLARSGDHLCFPMPGLEDVCQQYVDKVQRYIPLETMSARIWYLIPEGVPDEEADHLWGNPSPCIVNVAFTRRMLDVRDDKPRFAISARHPATGRIIVPRRGKVFLDEAISIICRMKNCGFTKWLGTQQIPGDEKRRRTIEVQHDAEDQVHEQALATVGTNEFDERMKLLLLSGEVWDQTTGRFISARVHLQMYNPRKAENRDAVEYHYREKCRIDQLVLKDRGFSETSERCQRMMAANDAAKNCLLALIDRKEEQMRAEELRRKQQLEEQIAVRKAQIFREMAFSREALPLDPVCPRMKWSEEVAVKLAEAGLDSVQKVAFATDAELKSAIGSANSARMARRVNRDYLELTLGEELKAAYDQIDQEALGK